MTEIRRLGSSIDTSPKIEREVDEVINNALDSSEWPDDKMKVKDRVSPKTELRRDNRIESD